MKWINTQYWLFCCAGRTFVLLGVFWSYSLSPILYSYLQRKFIVTQVKTVWIYVDIVWKIELLLCFMWFFMKWHCFHSKMVGTLKPTVNLLSCNSLSSYFHRVCKCRCYIMYNTIFSGLLFSMEVFSDEK